MPFIRLLSKILLPLRLIPLKLKGKSQKMNQYHKYLSAIFLILLGLSSCDDGTSELGVKQQPDNVKLETYTKQFKVTTSTVPFTVNSEDIVPSHDDGYHVVYVSSPYSFVGRLPDKYFKTIACEYLCQLYSPKGFLFKEKPYENKIDSTRVSLYYSTYSGAANSPIKIEAYKLGNTIPHNKYSVSDISQYGPFTLLGSTSILPSEGSNKELGLPIGSGVKVVSIPVDNSLGQTIYDLSSKHDKVFSSQESFNEFFPGLYITTGAGAGGILHVFQTSLSMYYTVEKTIKSSQGTDSLALVANKQELMLTPEVFQLMRFKHDNLESLLIDGNKHSNEEYFTNIKSPAGVVTELTFPTKQIKDLLDKAPQGFERELISIHFTILGEPSQGGDYNLPTPSNLLMLPKDSVVNFFENNKTELSAPYTSFLSSSYSEASTNYDFKNVVTIVNRHIKNKPNEDLKVWILPVDRATQQSSNTGGNSTSQISNLLKPTGLKIKSTPETRTFKIVYSERKLENK